MLVHSCRIMALQRSRKGERVRKERSQRGGASGAEPKATMQCTFSPKVPHIISARTSVRQNTWTTCCLLSSKQGERGEAQVVESTRYNVLPFTKLDVIVECSHNIHFQVQNVCEQSSARQYYSVLILSESLQ